MAHRIRNLTAALLLSLTGALMVAPAALAHTCTAGRGQDAIAVCGKCESGTHSHYNGDGTLACSSSCRCNTGWNSYDRQWYSGDRYY